MKWVLVLIGLLLLAFIPYNALAAYIWPDVSGDGVYGSGADTIDVNEYFGIYIFLYNDYLPLLGWSTPFILYGSGNVTDIAYATIIVTDPMQYFLGGPAIQPEDMDGVLPDKFSIHGVLYPILPPAPEDRLMFVVSLKILGDESTEGTFCIDSTDFYDDTYDWLFDPHIPFQETCWPVKYRTIPIMCGDVDENGLVNMLDITYLTAYLYLGGPEPYYIRLADVNGSCSIDILDVTYLISYLYLGGDAPQCPNEWPCSRSLDRNNFIEIPVR